MEHRDASCAFHQLPGDPYGSWVIEAYVPLDGRHACITEQGEWLIMDTGQSRSTPGVISSFGTGRLSLDLSEDPPARWSQACVAGDDSPLLEGP